MSDPINTLSIEKLLIGHTVLNVTTEYDKNGIEWIVLHLDSAYQIHINHTASGLVVVHPYTQ